MAQLPEKANDDIVRILTTYRIDTNNQAVIDASHRFLEGALASVIAAKRAPENEVGAAATRRYDAAARMFNGGVARAASVDDELDNAKPPTADVIATKLEAANVDEYLHLAGNGVGTGTGTGISGSASRPGSRGGRNIRSPRGL